MIEEFLIPLPGVKPTLEALEARGIAVAVLTNGWSPFQQRKAARAGFRGHVLVSSEIGERKPSLRAFEMLLEVLGTPPHQTAYVGDDPRDDVAGARDAGIQTVWINWERLKYPAELPPPQHTIAAFPELLELVPQFVRAS
jgi:putative hydrolase of the HAD superfamily